MGCDIHFHSEVKVKGAWHHYGSASLKRDYALFAVMANVRNEDGSVIPISMPKGLPKDISFVTQIDADYWGTDAHSASWLNREEIGCLQVYLEGRLGDNAYRLEMDYWGYLFGNSWTHSMPYRVGGHIIEDVRFVFWFDN